MDRGDLGLLVVRVMLGSFLAAHGYNKVAGSGGMSGTARWFASIGMRWPTLQARLAAMTELGAGTLFAVGLFTPLAAAGIVGVMSVATYAAHRQAFFVFNNGWEYTVSIAVTAWAIAAIGAGDASLDHTLGIDWTAWDGWIGAVLAGVIGVCGAALQLAACYRPQSIAST